MASDSDSSLPTSFWQQTRVTEAERVLRLLYGWKKQQHQTFRSLVRDTARRHKQKQAQPSSSITLFKAAVTDAPIPASSVPWISITYSEWLELSTFLALLRTMFAHDRWLRELDWFVLSDEHALTGNVEHIWRPLSASSGKDQPPICFLVIQADGPKMSLNHAVRRLHGRPFLCLYCHPARCCNDNDSLHKNARMMPNFLMKRPGLRLDLTRSFRSWYDFCTTHVFDSWKRKPKLLALLSKLFVDTRGHVTKTLQLYEWIRHMHASKQIDSALSTMIGVMRKQPAMRVRCVRAQILQLLKPDPQTELTSQRCPSVAMDNQLLLVWQLLMRSFGKAERKVLLCRQFFEEELLQQFPNVACATNSRRAWFALASRVFQGFVRASLYHSLQRGLLRHHRPSFGEQRWIPVYTLLWPILLWHHTVARIRSSLPRSTKKRTTTSEESKRKTTQQLDTNEKRYRKCRIYQAADSSSEGSKAADYANGETSRDWYLADAMRLQTYALAEFLSSDGHLRRCPAPGAIAPTNKNPAGANDPAQLMHGFSEEPKHLCEWYEQQRQSRSGFSLDALKKHNIPIHVPSSYSCIFYNVFANAAKKYTNVVERSTKKENNRSLLRPKEKGTTQRHFSR